MQFAGDLRFNGDAMAAPDRRDLPPPISCLAKAEDLPHVPWVMRRYHTSDGRLVIKEEKARGRHYFVADRSEGRLVMYLVHVDGDEDGEEGRGDLTAAEAGEVDGDAAGEEEGRGDLMAAAEVEGVAYKYTGAGVKPCGGFVATAPVFMPPVHI